MLDQYDMTAAILTCVSPFPPCGPNRPTELGIALNPAFNDCGGRDLAGCDPRYYGSIAIARDLPDIVGEIRRCKEGPWGNRFAQVLISPAGQEPLGKPRYWPIFEACAHYDLPIAATSRRWGSRARRAGRRPITASST